MVLSFQQKSSFDMKDKRTISTKMWIIFRPQKIIVDNTEKERGLKDTRRFRRCSSIHVI